MDKSIKQSLLKLFHGLEFSNHYSDLYILPNTQEQLNSIIDWLDDKDICYHMSTSDVKGQEWYSKRFIEIPGGYYEYFNNKNKGV